ncbi:unnamed protein product, partial [Linum tenue]
YTNVDLASKIFNSLPRSWIPKITTIEEFKDIANLELSELICSLTAHESVLRIKGDEQPRKRKDLALKSHLMEDEEEIVEQIALLSNKFRAYTIQNKLVH